MSNIKIQGNASGTGTTTLQTANTNSDTTFTLPGTDGTNGQAIVTNGSGTLSFSTVGSGDVVGPASATDNAVARFDLTTGKLIQNSAVTIADTTGDIAGAGSITSTSASGILNRAAATQDGVIIAGRAGGTSSYAVTLTPTTLSANRTLTLPNVTDTVATIGTAQTFTAAQTFRAASAIRSEAASTQDAIVIAGRAGGTDSYALTITPETLSASRTVTFPDGGGNYTVGYRNVPAVGTKTSSYTLATADVGKYVQVGTSGSITIPDATFAEGDIISLFNNTTGNITITCSITDAYIAGTDTDKATMTLATRGVATILFISSTRCVVSGNVT